ncbi:MAG: choice-of-anchor V domain-containing protein [Flavipsychrobacter sp.]
MKKTILLFTCISGLLYLTLTSSSNGASATPKGHTAASTGCGGSGCHGTAASTATTASITLKDKATGTTITSGKYESGKTYVVTVTGNNSAAVEFGYMLSTTNGSNGQAGTLANASAGSKIQTIPPGTYTVAEHNAPIPASSGMFTATFDWTAPATGTGNVTMNLAVNATNNNNATTGDQFNTTNLVLAEDNTSVGTIAKSISVSTYPNPVVNELNIKFGNIITSTYHIQVINMQGQIIAQQTNTVSSSSVVKLNTTNWASGIYHVVLNNGAAKQSIQIVK